MITVTNAANKAKADIYPHQIFGFTHSEGLQCTVIITVQGGQFPVLETKETILELIRKQKVSLAPKEG